MANVDVTRIASNIGALNSLWALQTINKQLGVAQTRLSTGKRINSAADDPAGLTIATKLNSRSEGLKVALGNIGDAKNLLAVAEAGVGRITDILVQMKNKASQGASDTMGSSERAAIKEQLNAYAEQINDIVAQTNWNGNNLINGKYLGSTLSFQTGADFADVTNLTGLTNLAATDGVVGVDGTGTGSLLLATKTATATVATSNDSSTILGTAGSAPATVATLNRNLTQLGTGTYTVKVTYGAVTATIADKIELLNSSGSALQISQTPGTYAAAGATETAVSTSYMTDISAGSKIVDFGNGLKVTFNNTGKFAGTDEATINYTAAGTYEVFSKGASSVSGSHALATAADYRDLMDTLETKLTDVNTMMAKIGAFTGRLEFKEDQVMAAQINVEASYNRIMNANMAEEQVNSSKFQILQQTAIAMLAQANQAPASLLSLFK
jgi:flagellin